MRDKEREMKSLSRSGIEEGEAKRVKAG